MRVVSLLLTLMLLHTLALAIPPSHSSSHKHKLKHKLKRQIEEELIGATEESVELLDHPRLHDTSEKMNEAAQQRNITAQRIKDSIEHQRLHDNQQRLQRVKLEQAQLATERNRGEKFVPEGYAAR